MVPATNAGRLVVERNDPAVVFDEQHHRIITERSLAALQRACVWMARVLGVPGPGADFVATQRALFRDHYDRLADAQQETTAHAERDLRSSRPLTTRGGMSVIVDEARRSGNRVRPARGTQRTGGGEGAAFLLRKRAPRLFGKGNLCANARYDFRPYSGDRLFRSGACDLSSAGR